MAAELAVAIWAIAPGDATPSNANPGEPAPSDGELTLLFDALLRAKEGPRVLAAALREKSLPAPIATLGLNRANAAGRDLKELSAALTAAGGLTPAAGHWTAEQIATLVADVTRSGSAERGEAVYRRAARAVSKLPFDRRRRRQSGARSG